MTDSGDSKESNSGASDAKPDAGKIDATPARSTVQIDGDTPAEGLMPAYKALDELADAIAAEVKAIDPKKLFIINPDDQKDIAALQGFEAQVELLKHDLEAAIEDAKKALNGSTPQKKPSSTWLQEPSQGFVAGSVVAAAGAASAIGGAISSFLGIASLFKHDLTYKATKISIEDRGLVTAVLGHLIKAAPALLIFDTATMPVPPPSDWTRSKIYHDLKELGALRSEVAALSAQIDEAIMRLAPEAPQPEEGKSATSQETPEPEKIKKLRASKAAAAAVLDEFKDFSQSLVKRSDTSVSRLFQLFYGEQLRKLAPGAHFLSLKVLAAGGSQIGVGKFLDSEFWFGGASIVSYVLFDETGAVKTAGTKRKYQLMKLLKDDAALVPSFWGK